MKTNDTAEKIKQLRIAQNMTLEDVAKKVGVGKSTVRKWETGMIANMKRDKILLIANALGTTPAYLMGWTSEKDNVSFSADGIKNIQPISVQKIPLLGKIACGKPIFAEEEHESYIAAGTKIKADFCLICQGDSMIGAGIHNGDIVFVRQQPMVNNGEIAVVLINEKATLKRVYYYSEKSKLVLNPENPKYEPLVYMGEELNDIRILGKAIAYQSDIV